MVGEVIEREAASEASPQEEAHVKFCRRSPQNRSCESLLPGDALQVTSVAEGVPGSDVGQCLPAVEGVTPRLQVQPRLGVVDRRRIALGYPANGVDHVLEPVEVDHDEVIDVDVGVALDGLDDARGAQCGLVPVQVADRERLVDLERLRRGLLAVAHPAGRDVHP